LLFDSVKKNATPRKLNVVRFYSGGVSIFIFTRFITPSTHPIQ
jgi:hypothetical protein